MSVIRAESYLQHFYYSFLKWPLLLGWFPNPLKFPRRSKMEKSWKLNAGTIFKSFLVKIPCLRYTLRAMSACLTVVG